MDRPSDEHALAALAALEGKTTLVIVTRRPGWKALSQRCGDCRKGSTRG